MNSPEPSSWQRAVLPLLLLQELSTGPAHGYALGRAIADRGFAPLKGATLYPALARLEESGLVSTHWEQGEGGPGRKVYEISSAGRRELESLGAAWAAFAARVGG